MNRPIKFRAWVKSEKRMETFSFWDWHAMGSTYWEHPWADPDKVEVMQFTGVHDKNGREIYEGDIILSFLDKGREGQGRQHAEIVFIEGGFGAKLIKTEPPDFRHFTPGEGMPNFHWGTYSSVVGNIHENPEMVA